MCRGGPDRAELTVLREGIVLSELRDRVEMELRAPRGRFHESVERSYIQHLLTHARPYGLLQEDAEGLRRVLLEKTQDGVFSC